MAITNRKLSDAQPKTAREMGIMQGFPPPPEKRPTKENWDQAPFNRWSFQNMRTLFPTADVRRHGPISLLPHNLRELGHTRYRGADGAERTVAEGLAMTYTDGFLLAHRGEVLSETYFNDMQPHSPHLGQSVSKSLIGVLAGILHDEGILDLSAPLADLVPELGQCGYANATLTQVLDMQSGVKFTEDYGLPDSDMTRIDIASGWRPAPTGQEAPTIRDVMLTLRQERPHGDLFSYRSIETDVVAWALERAAGKSVADLISERIWAHLGAERDAFFTVDSAGVALADGGFNATMRDYARFALMMANQGRVGDVQVVPKAWIDMSRQGDPGKFTGEYEARFKKGAYKNFWWILDADRGDLMARGVFGQLIYVDIETGFVVVILSTWPDYLIPSFSDEVIRAVLALRQAVTGE